jgi:iron complex outermembrane receptor protein
MRLLAILGLATALTTDAAAQPATSPTQPLRRLSIEELSQIDVTTVSKHAESVSEAAAAIAVITGDDIRRAGIQTLPEALRLATGVAVARSNGRTWAISARGFNITTANKMVVLLDGRSVYTPLFSGVLWDTPDVVLEDVDRIEVIRGPGGALWGANAVNGVINIITRSSADTQGGLVQVGAGNQLGKTAVRYGGRIGGDTTYRVYAKYRHAAAEALPSGASARDPQDFAQIGVRIDSGTSGHTTWTLHADTFGGTAGLADRSDSHVVGADVLGRVLHTYSSGAQIQAQAYYDGTFRHVPRQFTEHRDTIDFDLQYRRSLARVHDLTVGAGYQMTKGRARPTPVLFFEPESRTSPLVNVYLQDAIAIVPGTFDLIVGSKFEHNDYTGFEYQPTGRVRWTPGAGRTLWASVSRAVRMPTRFDADLRITGAQSFLVLRGNPAFRSETVLAHEIGYRRSISRTLSIDIAAFLNDYNDLRTQEPTPPSGFPIVLANNMNARVAGVEATVNYQAAPTWQLHAGYSRLSERFRFEPGSRGAALASAEHNDPRNQLWLRSFLDLPGRTELDAVFRFVGELRDPHVPRYGELTLHLGLRRGGSPEIGIVGDNLLHDRHPEFGNPQTRGEFRRTIFGQLTWRF